jgi:hypothetical protein
VEPWLGDRAAYFAMDADDAYGMVFDAEDEDAAEAFGRRVTAAASPPRTSTTRRATATRSAGCAARRPC